jgi:hypothetical protein
MNAPLKSLISAVALLPVLSTGLPACTTSRAVVAWHDGWIAEEQGDLALAEKRYGEAAGYDKGQVGAACNQVRLMARHPDRRDQSKEQLDLLIKAKPAWPEVATIGSLAALHSGDAKLADQRLKASRALNDADRRDVRHALRFAKVSTAAVQGRWREATDEKLLVGLAEDATAARMAAAAAAYNGGELALAARLMPPQSLNAQDNSVAATELRASLAAEQGQWQVVRREIEALALAERSPRLEALRAWSLLRSGDAAAGLAAAAEASRRQPDDPYVSQVWAAAQLANGQAQLARDLLAVLAARGGGWSTWHDLGLAQLALADPQAALSSFEQAAARCPGCEPAVKNRNALRRILGAL